MAFRFGGVSAIVVISPDCMNSLVSFVFDCIGAFSAALQVLFFGVARGSSDLTAALLSATCLLVIMACHDMLVARDRWRRALRSVFVPFAVLFAGQFLVVHLGSKVVPLRQDRIEPVEDKCYRTTLPKDLADPFSGSEWMLMSSRSRLSPQQWYLADPRMHRVEYRVRVLRAGGGRYHLNGRTLTFSMPDGTDPRSGGSIVSVVRERGWQRVVRTVLLLGYIAWAVWLALGRVLPLLRGAFTLLRRERLLLAVVCGFALFYGGHQWRFLSQDERMQMVTSRDDDGYMLARLNEAVQLKTMDPQLLNNNAYGAIAFYPFALPSFLAGHAGLTPSVECLNAWVRGLKLLVSLGALVAVWLLGAGRFGRAAALAAVLLLATNIGFLSYSSFPFYPDVLMALLSTLSLHYLLKLRDGWDVRAFSLALVFAAMSVSIKFLTFLLFPFIIFIGAAALWREHQGRRSEQFVALAWCGVLAGVLCVAVFFLCNPYLAYNIEWMVPNYKMCGNYYSAESSQIVANIAATLSNWIEICYRHGSDASDLVLADIAILATLVIWIRHRTSATADRQTSSLSVTATAAGGAGVLLLFALLSQLYLVRSVTLTSMIDRRLLLPVYPIFYLLAAWGVVQLFRSVGGTRLWSKVILATLIGAASLMLVVTPRLSIAMDFFRHFGRVPETSDVSAWLSDAGVPKEARIMTSLQSCFPAKFRQLVDGIWNPATLRSLFFQRSALPDIFFEDEGYYDQFFSNETRKRGFNTQGQNVLFEEGSEFYRLLRTNQLTPFVLVAEGWETVATHALSATSTRFRAYVNPHAFSENLAARAIMTITDSAGRRVTDRLTAMQPGALSVEWPSPVSAGVVYLSVREPDCEALRLRIEDAGGHEEVLPTEMLGAVAGQSTERYLRLEPSRDVRKITVLSAESMPSGAGKVTSLRIHPPVPLGLNPTRYYFEIHDEAGNGSTVENLIAWRHATHTGFRITPQHSSTFVLTPKIKCDVAGTCIVLDDAPPGASTARCTYIFKDGKQSSLEGVEKRTVSPAHVYFKFDCPAGQTVDRIECQISTTADATVRQVQVQANPVVEEAGK